MINGFVLFRSPYIYLYKIKQDRANIIESANIKISFILSKNKSETKIQMLHSQKIKFAKLNLVNLFTGKNKAE